MRNFFVLGCAACLLLIDFTPALSQYRWKTFTDLSPNYTWDVQTARLTGPYIAVWTLSPVLEAQRQYQRGRGENWTNDWVSTRERLLLDCKNIRVKFLDIVNLGEDGIPLWQVSPDQNAQPWTSVGPDTIMEAKMSTICKHFGR